MSQPKNGLWPAELTLLEKSKGKSKALALRPTAVYRKVCFETDPPLSVAVSQTRQCVAFGSAKGVELYWVDTSTGQDMNRWFALRRPSHHLHFLPPRRDVDIPLKLRLISSAQPPGGSSYLSGLENPADETGNAVSASNHWLRWSLRKPSHAGEAYSHAIPLSDGHHILYTDDRGLLCLGADQHVGRSQSLSRKFVFEPPSHLAVGGEAFPKPGLSAAAWDLERGARVAAAYGSEIVLYSVPVDALRYSTAEQGGDYVGQSNMLWVDWSPGTAEIWPLPIQGVRVCSVTSPAALCVQTGSAVAVWVFGKDGDVEIWCG